MNKNMKKKVKQSFIASVEDDYMDQIGEIADQLRSKGCEINEVLEITGVITGKAKIQVNFDDLQIEGIASIEEQRVIKKTVIVSKHKKQLTAKSAKKRRE